MKYTISKSAYDDLRQIKVFGTEFFGRDAANKYIKQIRTKIQSIARLPLIYQEANHIRENYRRAVYKSHSIYFKIEEGRVIVMRIIGQQDI